ncbi:hypothetical protein LU604_25270 [Erwinia tracheiphila]|uniref:DUF1311 domain-containing protein n=1 Tax=Erwinia tracheiphila TaxID=65700 RepID=A0A345CWH8_9GAMM|nr:hypothetical protein [Erwinia tracheiphila]AXF77795.1 hypothetical protein AV903_19910 [Erwinia tracheiphila]UIA83512.1 hypothetical protein LU604_25270 [Erwinia tracheiphila]UIA92096.1 hypothetical protein LU632_24735 [Erwinia tracheiphila]
MKVSNFLIITIFFSFSINAAFTEPEMSQLNDINEKYIKEAEIAKKKLNASIKESISNLPKERSNILRLHKLLEEATKEKCRLMILESLNTDAEIASKYECLANEYNSESKFFRSIY